MGWSKNHGKKVKIYLIVGNLFVEFTQSTNDGPRLWNNNKKLYSEILKQNSYVYKHPVDDKLLWKMHWDACARVYST